MKQKIVPCSQPGCGKQLTEDYVYMRDGKVFCLSHAMVGITGKILKMQCDHSQAKQFGSIKECECGAIIGSQPATV